MATKKTTKKAVKKTTSTATNQKAKTVKKSPLMAKTEKVEIMEAKVENMKMVDKDNCECGPDCSCSCKVNRKKLASWIVLAVLVILTGLYFFKGFFIVALVNNKPISRFSLDRELEKQAGKAILNNKIAEMLVIDEGIKQKITVSQEEIDAKMKTIEDQIKAQGQTLEALFAAQGINKEEFLRQIKIQILVEKMLDKDIAVTDQEISDYFTQNKAALPAGATLESQKESIRESLIQQKLTAKIQPWLEELKAKAKIFNFIEL